MVLKNVIDIQNWKDAPLWTPKSIRGATKTWFKYMKINKIYEKNKMKIHI